MDEDVDVVEFGGYKDIKKENAGIVMMVVVCDTIINKYYLGNVNIDMVYLVVE